MADGEPRDGGLTRREQEVAQAYALGASYKEIARDLGVSPTTVRSHLRTVYGKLGVTSKIELARFIDDGAAQARGDVGDMAAELALELDEAARRERSLARVLRIISEQEDSPERVIDAVLDHALEICEAEFGVLFEYAGGMRFRELRSRNIAPPFAAWLAEQGLFEVEPETGIGRVAAQMQAINIPDVRIDEAFREAAPLRVATAELGRARSFAAIPMISRGRLIGVFTVYRTRVHPFSERAVELAQVFADQAAIAIETARRFRALETRLARERTNREILEIIRRNRDDEQPVFEAIVRSAVELCGVRFSMFWRFDGALVHYCASPGFSAGFMADYLAAYPKPPEPGGLVEAVLRTGRTVHLPHAQDPSAYYEAEIARAHDYDHMIAVPVETDGGIWGVLVLAWPTGRAPEDGQVELLETFVTQAVIAIENVARFRELRARLERERGLAEILQLLSRSREDEGPIFDLILRKAEELCAADAAALTLGREGDAHQVMAAARGVHPRTRALYDAGQVSMRPASYAAQAILSGAPVHVEDFAETPGYRDGDLPMRSLVEDTGMRTSLFVPLVARDGGIGALILFRREVRPYSPDEIALVGTFAAQAVIAVENVRQVRELARLNAELGDRVEAQGGEIARMARLKRFMSPAVAEALARSGGEEILASHRSLIATLFCDIRGFTAFCERAEPEETIEVLQTYHEELGKLISAHGAGVDKRMGDGIMVVFNDPFPCEDPAGDALRLAVAMRDRMAELCQGWKRLGHRLGFGVGVSLGYATIGVVGSEGRYDYTASGAAVNLAARLCDRAEDGEILLSPRAATAVEDAFALESSGELTLKGIREPVEVFRLVDA